MIDLTENLISLPIDDLRDKLQTMSRPEIVGLVRTLEAENERLKGQLTNLDPGLEPHRKKEGYRGFILGKLRLCNDRLGELKAEVVTMGVFFRLDQDGMPDFYLKAARLPPNQYKEALLRSFGAKCPAMVNHYKVDPSSVPAELWDDIDSGDLERLHEAFSR